MASKTFISGTVIDSAWLNDVNDNTYAAEAAPAGSFREALAASTGSSLVGHLPSGVGTVTTTVRDKLDQYRNVLDFVPLGVDISTTDCTEFVKTAIANTPSNGVLNFPGGTMLLSSSATTPITIDKRLLIDGNGTKIIHNPASTGSLFVVSKTGATPAADLNFNGQLEGVSFCNFWISGAAIPNGAIDNRTSIADVLVFDNALDGFTARNIYIEGFKGAGILITGAGSIRESYFENITIRYCGYNTGNNATDRAQIHIINVQLDGDAHNQLIFKKFRLIYSLWRDIRIMPNPVNPCLNPVRLVRFIDCQIENDLANDPYWNTPPAVEKVWIEEAGGYISFENTEFFNPYATDLTKWGYPSVRIGNKPAGTGADRVQFLNCLFQGNSLGGMAIELQKANICTLTATRSSILNFNEARTIVVAEINPTDAYGVSSAPASYAYVRVDPSCDFGVSPYYHDNTYSRFFGSLKVYESPDPYQEVCFYPGGFASARTSFSAESTGVTYTEIDMSGPQFIPPGVSSANLNNSVWLISASGSYAGGQSSASCLVTTLDVNTVAAVVVLGAGSLNATLQITFRCVGGNTPGTAIGGIGYKFDVEVTNTAGGPIGVSVSATRFGVA
ncbi:MAG: hypothetical protein WAV48_04900 [Candidatus Magasanikiibacteriota bacterium]